MPLSKITGNSFSSSANTNIDNSTLFVDVTNNRIGAGVSGPQVALDVNAGIRVQSITNPTTGSGMELAYDGTQGIIQAYSNRAALTSVPVYLVTGQLKFPASQNASSDANTLDDYEEGTWTVNPVRWTWTGSKTGSYIKIGRLVHLNYVVDATSISYTGAGSGWAIDGWPFTIDSVAIASLGECTAFTTNIFLDNIGNQLFGRTSTNTASGIGSGGNFNASGRIKFTLTYYTSS
jgi:hypothetical protein